MDRSIFTVQSLQTSQSRDGLQSRTFPWASVLHLAGNMQPLTVEPAVLEDQISCPVARKDPRLLGRVHPVVSELPV